MDARTSIDARLERLFGAGIDWRRATGLVQVTALDARSRAVLAIGPGAPASPTDRFVLGFARARADAIVTTGAILRAEPDLVHRFADEPAEERAWRVWRRTVLGRSEAPRVLVLSRSGRIPPAHPALTGSGRPVLWTRAMDAAGSEGGAPASLARAIAWLRAQVGAQTITIEAGPAATLGLYRASGDPVGSEVERDALRAARIDELLLALFVGHGAPVVAGESFPSAERLAAYFAGTAPGASASSAMGRTREARREPIRSRVEVEEAGGSWIFERHRRADSIGD